MNITNLTVRITENTVKSDKPMEENNNQFNIKIDEYSRARSISISLTDKQIEMLDALAENLGFTRSGTIAFALEAAEKLVPMLKEPKKFARMFGVKLNKSKRRRRRR